jgi:DNA ligase D-like protein (predicted 3'-phosphoesterase)
MPIFVIQEHHARNLHWDLRLELGGALKSWALPKTPPKQKGLKRLAIQVPDHAKDYANFEGEIKEGYGKGKVKIWDKGNYTLLKRTPKEIEVKFQGKQLHGRYVLVNAKLSGDKKNWLFMRLD